MAGILPRPVLGGIMIPDIALIAAAGWKPADEWRLRGKWRDIVPLRTPEVLWPLPDGQTVLSRYCAQLNKIGVGAIFVGVGNPDNSPTESIEHRHKARCGAEVSGHGNPVWTHDKIEYIRGLGCYPLFIEDPMAPKKCCWTTIVDMLDMLDAGGTMWDTLMTLMGDYVLKTSFLEERMANCLPPEQIWLLPKHSFEFLGRASARRFASFLKTIAPKGQTEGWRQRLKSGLLQKYIWNVDGLSREAAGQIHAERRKQFCEVGPGEYPHAWALAKGDPV